MKKALLSLQFMLLAVCLFSQTSILQDSKGETGLSLGSVGVVAINAKDESISFSYGVPLFKSHATNAWRQYIGGSAKAKGKNGLAPILKGEDFQYDGNIGLFYFREKTKTSGTIYQLNAAIDYLFNQFKLYDSSSTIPFNRQIYDMNKSGYKLTIGGALYSGNSPFVLGVSLNGGKKNNTGDLKALELAGFSTDTSGNQIRVILTDKTNAYNVNQYKSSLGYFNMNADIGLYAFKQVVFFLHSRWSAQQDRKPQFNPAMGLYFTKAKAPLEVVAGIQLQVADWANSSDSEKTRKQRTVVNVVAGFTF